MSQFKVVLVAVNNIEDSEDNIYMAGWNLASHFGMYGKLEKLLSTKQVLSTESFHTLWSLCGAHSWVQFVSTIRSHICLEMLGWNVGLKIPLPRSAFLASFYWPWQHAFATWQVAMVPNIWCYLYVCFVFHPGHSGDYPICRVCIFQNGRWWNYELFFFWKFELNTATQKARPRSARLPLICESLIHAADDARPNYNFVKWKPLCGNSRCYLRRHQHSRIAA